MSRRETPCRYTNVIFRRKDLIALPTPPQSIGRPVSSVSVCMSEAPWAKVSILFGHASRQFGIPRKPYPQVF